MIRLLQDALTAAAAERPGKVALICEKRRLTYAELEDLSGRLANAFRARGLVEGDRVVLSMANGVDLVVGLFAALKAGLVFAAVDYAATYDRLRAVAVDSGAAALMTHGLQAGPAARLLADVPSLRFAVLAGPADHPDPPRLLDCEALLRDFPPAAPPASRIDCDPAYLLYTSGSTGAPKGVLTTHRSSLFTVASGIEYFGLVPEDVLVDPLPLSFSPGMNTLLKSVLIGATLILEPSLGFPAATLKRMAAEGATGFFGVPTVLALLLRSGLERYDLGRLRFVASVGAAFDPGLIRRLREALPRVEIRSFYGLAEAAYSLALDPGLIDSHPTSVGRPFPGTQAAIVGDDGRPVGPGEAGELVVRGGHVRSGYWNDPAASAERFRPGPVPGELVCRTGDVFREDEDGLFYFLGRRDEMIKSGGKKVAPREIESVLLSLPGVLEAAAVGIADPVLGTVIKAFLVPDGRTVPAPTEAAALDHCRSRLEDYKIPRWIEIRDSLPKTAGGKIRKAELAGASKP